MKNIRNTKPAQALRGRAERKGDGDCMYSREHLEKFGKCHGECLASRGAIFDSVPFQPAATLEDKGSRSSANPRGKKSVADAVNRKPGNEQT